jgi:hypothetical protein
MACFLRMHSIWRVLCRTLSANSVPFHLAHDCSSSAQQIPIAVAAYFALASVAVVRSVGLDQAHYKSGLLHAISRAAFWTSGIFLEAELEEVLLVRSFDAVLSGRKK